MFIFIIFFFIGILIAWLNSKSSQSNTITQHNTVAPSNNSFNLYNNASVREHFDNIEKIKAQYSVLYNLKQFHSPEMDKLIELCKRDIFIAEEVVSMFKYYNQEPPKSYYTFKQLAIIYEKRHEYGKAIDVCVEAIELGFTDDDTMYGRLARLLRKEGQNELADKYSKMAKK